MSLRSFGFACAALAATFGAMYPTVGARAAGPATEVVIESGAIRGALEGDVLAWKGVPFAAPPVGPNRWRAPQPVTPWTGVREATSYGHDCMQQPMPGDVTPLTTTPAEDCLYLNVWKPAKAPAGRKLPVVVWIYGGGFMWGGSSIASTNGARLAEKGVILVSFNYRLGRLGYFAHPALAAAHEGPVGNFGYMDIVAALQWVKRNIGQFGGDPGAVTVFGESAGGAAAMMVLTSPATEGLFNRVLVMSGGGLSPTGLPMRRVSEDLPGLPSAEAVGVNFAKTVGVEGTGPEALAQLRAVPAERVVQGVSMRDLFAADPGATYTGGPLQDGSIALGPPLQLVANGQKLRVPVMIGTTSGDVGGSTARTLDEVFAPFGPKAAEARKAYDPAGTGDLRTVGDAVAMDRMMTAPARYMAAAAARSGEPAYFYRFSYVADSLAARQKGGARHASDVPFVFGNADIRYGAQATAKDRAVADVFRSYLANFARNGDPNGPGLPRWKPFAKAPGEVLDFGADGNVAQRPDPWKARLDVATSMIVAR